MASLAYAECADQAQGASAMAGAAFNANTHALASAT